MYSKSEMEKKLMSTEQKLLMKRRAYYRNLDRWRRICPRNVGKNGKENMKEEKACGKEAAVMVGVL
jgi:hypothetical protein